MMEYLKFAIVIVVFGAIFFSFYEAVTYDSHTDN